MKITLFTYLVVASITSHAADQAAVQAVNHSTKHVSSTHVSSTACQQYYTMDSKTLFARWLEEDSKERESWISYQSGQTLQKLSHSENYETLSNITWGFLNSSRTLSSVQVNNDQFKLLFKGLGQPQEVIKISQSHTQEVLLNTLDLKHDGSFSVFKMDVSPDGKKLILYASDNGNIDYYNFYVWDIETKQIILDTHVSDPSILWLSEHEFQFRLAQKKQVTESHVYNISNQTLKKNKHSKITPLDSHHYVEEKNNSWFLVTTDSEKPNRTFIPKSLIESPYSIESIENHPNQSQLKVITLKNSYGNFGEVILLDKSNKKTKWKKIINFGQNKVLTSTQAFTDHIIVSSFMGEKIFNQIFDYQGKEIFSINTPACCTINSIEFDPQSDVVKINFSSQVQKSLTFDYSRSKNKFTDSDYENKLLSFDGIQFTSYINWAKSKDGTMIPTRITHRKDLKKNSKNPLLMYGYGGFNLPGYFRDPRKSMDYYFMKAGGIIAGPALRGGDEFGPSWHEQAAQLNKHKTLEDFEAAAELIQGNGYTKPEITALQGWSNGGFVVSSTGLIYSDKFGVIISGNGVNDQFRKEKLDPEFGPGWVYEYPDSRNKKNHPYLKTISPVYLAQLLSSAEAGKKPQKKSPKILIANGRDDSRVNSAHSFKLYHALKLNAANPEDIHILSINNAGHWMTSATYQNLIGWKSTTLIWTYIFDVMNMKAQY